MFLFVMVMIGNDGGKIRHSELRGDSNQNSVEMELNDDHNENHDDD